MARPSLALFEARRSCVGCKPVALFRTSLCGLVRCGPSVPTQRETLPLPTGRELSASLLARFPSYGLGGDLRSRRRGNESREH